MSGIVCKWTVAVNAMCSSTLSVQAYTRSVHIKSCGSVDAAADGAPGPDLRLHGACTADFTVLCDDQPLLRLRGNPASSGPNLLPCMYHYSRLA